MNFLHKSKVDPLTKTHFFCLVHVIPISHLSYPPGPLVVFWETPSRNFLFFWPGLISWLHRFLKSVVSFRARPSRVISMFSSGVCQITFIYWSKTIQIFFLKFHQFPWCSGHHIHLLTLRSPVRSRANIHFYLSLAVWAGMW